MRRGSFGTRWGFYFAAIGSAFGLGSLWRFPYVVAENGGGAFVLLYFGLLMLIGVPLLISELMLGKFSRRSVISAFRQLRAQRHSEARSSWMLRAAPWVSKLTVVIALFILAYYSVISGWVLHFFLQFSAAPFFDDPDRITHTMDGLVQHGWLQLLLASGHLMVVVFFVLKGVEDGIEKAVGYIIPVFVGILFILMMRAFQLDSRAEALRYFLYPDVTKLNLSSLGAAVGQLCFTLSVGIATMITFGSYLRDEARVPATGLRVAMMDSVSALVAGLLVFPLVVGGRAPDVTGVEILFRTVPEFLIKLDGGILFGLFFFLCLYLAALGASISILEAIVANLEDSYNFKRARATWLSGGMAFLLTIVPALSSSVLRSVSFGSSGILEVVDKTLINWIVPLIALFTSQIVVYKLNDSIKRQEFMVDHEPTAAIMYSHWSIVLRWVVPPLIILALILQLIDLFV